MAVTAPTDFWAEAKRAMRDALKSRAVLVTAMICATVLGLAVVGVLGWLAWAQRDASTVLGLVNLLLTAAVWTKAHDAKATAARVEKQTNGHTERLMDAALKDKG